MCSKSFTLLRFDERSIETEKPFISLETAVQDFGFAECEVFVHSG